MEYKGIIFNIDLNTDNVLHCLFSNFEDNKIYKLFYTKQPLEKHILSLKSLFPAKIEMDGSLSKDNNNIIKYISNYQDDNNYWPEILNKTKNSHLSNACINSFDRISNELKNNKVFGLADFNSIESFFDLYDYSKKNNVKPIYGFETSIFFKENKVFKNIYDKNKCFKDYRFIMTDLETNGLFRYVDEIIEIGYVEFDLNSFISENNIFIKDPEDLPYKDFLLEYLPSLKNKTYIQNAKPRKESLEKFFNLFENDFENIILLSHRRFDLAFLNHASKKYFNKEFKPNYIDSRDLCRLAFPEIKSYSLDKITNFFQFEIDQSQRHKAVYDAKVTSLYAKKAIEKLGTDIPITQLEKIQSEPTNIDTYNVTLIAKNQKGLESLYELFSLSQTENYYKFPRLNWEEVQKYRKDLIVISKLSVYSEVYEKFFFDTEDIKNYTEKYDYISIFHPDILNSNFSQSMGKLEYSTDSIIQSYKDIYNCISEKIIYNSCAEYLFPKEHTALGILKLFFTSTNINRLNLNDSNYKKQYKLDEINFLNELNKNKILNNQEKLISETDGFNIEITEKFYPILDIDIYEKEFINIIESETHSKYGKASQNVKIFIEEEYKKLKKNNFLIIYYIVHNIVTHIKNKFDILIGSRGSIGSSFLAFILNITEVNPLKSHLYCKDCGFFEFLEEKNGFDHFDDKLCFCNKECEKNGFNISFTMFGGLNGEKLPDIDLNIPALLHKDIQKEIICFMKEKYDVDCLYSGTSLKLKGKNSIFYVKSFIEKTNIQLDYNYQLFLSELLIENVLSITQHPGGIFLFPKNKKFSKYTPLHRGKNEQIIAHFGHKKLSQLFKLDILAHEDPATLKKLCDLTNIKVEDIKINKDLINFLGDYKNTTGLPEFGTSFNKQIIRQLNPTSLENLISISGFTHGTNVWSNNAKDLFVQGISLNKLIACRDDIYYTLKEYNFSDIEAFNMSEFIRKGKVYSDKKTWNEYLVKLLEKNVPTWIIQSLSKIVYIFPRAHAVAYTLMAAKIAFFKQKYPYHFFTTFLNRKIHYLDESMLYSDVSTLKEQIKSLNKSREQKDKVVLQCIELIVEMLNKNIFISSINIFKSLPNDFFLSEDEKEIYPPFTLIKGFGEKAAQSIYETRNLGYKNFSDFKKKTKLSISQINLLNKYNLLPFDNISPKPLF